MAAERDALYHRGTMKKRRVILTIEIETDKTIRELRKLAAEARAPFAAGDRLRLAGESIAEQVLQLQANVVRASN